MIDGANRNKFRCARMASPHDRVMAGFVASAALAVLALAAWLKPAHAGFGTHEQLGLAPCTWAAVLGKPCPTCGMTTAFAHAADGNILGSFTAQPFGALLALLAAMIFWGGTHVAATGSTLGRLFGLLMLNRSLWIAAALLLAAWGYKILTWPGVAG